MRRRIVPDASHFKQPENTCTNRSQEVAGRRFCFPTNILFNVSGKTVALSWPADLVPDGAIKCDVSVGDQRDDEGNLEAALHIGDSLITVVKPYRKNGEVMTANGPR